MKPSLTVPRCFAHEDRSDGRSRLLNEWDGFFSRQDVPGMPPTRSNAPSSSVGQTARSHGLGSRGQGRNRCATGVLIQPLNTQAEEVTVKRE
jgi:hypothetical protein